MKKKKKKNYGFLIKKKTPSYAVLGSKQKTFSSSKATYQKELCLLSKNQAFFSQSAPSPCSF